MEISVNMTWLPRPARTDLGAILRGLMLRRRETTVDRAASRTASHSALPLQRDWPTRSRGEMRPKATLGYG